MLELEFKPEITNYYIDETPTDYLDFYGFAVISINKKEGFKKLCSSRFKSFATKATNCHVCPLKNECLAAKQ